MRARRAVALVLAGLVAVLSLVGCGKPAAPAEKVDKKDVSAPIVIGAVQSQTGERVALGEFNAIGVKMAVDEINKNGGILGRQIELALEDDQSKTPVTGEAINKIVSEHPDVVGIILPMYSTMVLGVEKIIGEKQVIGMTGGTNPKITSLGNEWLFRFRPHDGIQAQAMAKFAMEDLGGKKIAILHDTDEYGSTATNLAKAYLADKGIEVVVVESFNAGDKDFTPQLTSIKSKNPDVLLGWFTNPIEGSLILQQARQMDIKIPIVGSSSVSQPMTLKLAGEYAEGVYSGTDTIPLASRDDERSKKFVEQFKANARGEMSDNGASHYDAVYLLAEAIKRAGSTDRAKVREALLQIKDFEGVVTKYKFDEKGDSVFRAVIVQVKGGKALPVKVVEVN